MLSKLSVPKYMTNTSKFKKAPPRIKLVMNDPIVDQVQGVDQTQTVDQTQMINIQTIIDSIEARPRQKGDEYNFVNFVAAGKFKYGNRFSYRKIGINDITGSGSEVTVICNLCQYENTLPATRHLTGEPSCRGCSKSIKWTHQRLILLSKEKFGPNRFNYDLIKPESITGQSSEITVICNICSDIVHATVKSHMHNKEGGCRICGGNKILEYEEIMNRANNIHGNKFNYDRVPKTIRTNAAIMEVECKKCGYIWPVTVKEHIGHPNHPGCPDCAGNLPWTHERFLLKATKKYNDRFSYDLVKPEHVKNRDSKVKIRCNKCNFIWPVSINNIFHTETSCRRCSNRLPWTLDRFITESFAIHGNNFDYSEIFGDMITNHMSKIPVICKKCGHKGYPLISDHVTDQHRCHNCDELEQLTYIQFLERTAQMTSTKFVYPILDATILLRGDARICIKCNKCKTMLNPTIADHIYGRNGCAVCKISKGEKATAIAFQKLGIPHRHQFIIEPFKNKYDFIIEYNSNQYLVEFDGEQHFHRIPYFHPTEEIFQIRQQTDLDKTRRALDHGYRIIRIDFTKLKFVEDHIIEALRLDQKIYYSDAELYARFPTE